MFELFHKRIINLFVKLSCRTLALFSLKFIAFLCVYLFMRCMFVSDFTGQHRIHLHNNYKSRCSSSKASYIILIVSVGVTSSDLLIVKAGQETYCNCIYYSTEVDIETSDFRGICFLFVAFSFRIFQVFYIFIP